MKPARLRLAGVLLLIGVALGGAATGGYTLGAASSKPRRPAAEAPQAARSDEVVTALRQIERRLARLEGSAVLASTHGASPGDRAACADPAAGPAEAAGGLDGQTAAPSDATSDPELLLASQRVVEAALSARRFTEAQKETLRLSLPKLATEDRMAVMNQLAVAHNRGEIDFDALEVF
jgi:hypothetical protein